MAEFVWKLAEGLRRAYRGPGGGGGSVAEFVCACDERFRSVCEGLPADNEHEDKRYCVLHFPSVDKDWTEFEEAIREKLKAEDFDFRGIYVPGAARFVPNGTFEGDANFSWATFEGGADFSNATFEGEATFRGVIFKKRADFSRTIFEGPASFSSAIFKREAGFFGATFEGSASFTRVTTYTFEGDVFSGATLEGEESFSEAPTFEGDASFFEVTFKEDAYFSDATFKGDAYFSDAIFEGDTSFSDATFKGGALSGRYIHPHKHSSALRQLL